MQHFTNSLAIRSAAFLSKLQTPHDFSHLGDFRNDLPTLFDGSDVIEVTEQENKSCLNVFNDDSKVRKGSTVLTYFEFKQIIDFFSDFE